MKFNLEEIKKINKHDRMWFVKYWAHYVKTHHDIEWSMQQNILINSMIENAKDFHLTSKEYLKIKKEFKQNADNQIR